MPSVFRSDGTPLEKPDRRIFRNALRRAATVLRNRGARTLWFKLLGETVYRRLVVVEDDLERELAPLGPVPEIENGILHEDEIAVYLALRPDQDAREIRRRLAAGHRCSVTRDGGRIVGATWWACERAWIEPLDCEIALAPDEVYYYESYTDPTYRGHHLPAARTRLLRPSLRAEGIRRRIAVIDPEDASALRHAERAGFIPIGMMGYVRLGSWRHHFVRAADGKAHRLPKPRPRADWNETAERLLARGYAVDPFLAEQKRRAYLSLVERWAPSLHGSRALKTDLFEEALGGDAFLWDVGAAGTRRVGIDRSQVVAGTARARDARARIRALTADVRDLPFADRAFALVVSPSTLDHFPEPEDLGRSLREILRVLEPNGVLIVTLDNRENVSDGLLRFAARLGVVPFYLGRSYSHRELETELVQAGFQVTDQTTILHTPRLFAFGALRAARSLRLPPLVRVIERLLASMQRLEHGRFARRTGSFVAARAIRSTETGGAR